MHNNYYVCRDCTVQYYMVSHKLATCRYTYMYLWFAEATFKVILWQKYSTKKQIPTMTLIEVIK